MNQSILTILRKQLLLTGVPSDHNIMIFFIMVMWCVIFKKKYLADECASSTKKKIIFQNADVVYNIMIIVFKFP